MECLKDMQDRQDHVQEPRRKTFTHYLEIVWKLYEVHRSKDEVSNLDIKLLLKFAKSVNVLYDEYFTSNKTKPPSGITKDQ